MDLLEQVLRRTTESIRGMGHFYKNRLERVRAAHLGEEKALGRLRCGLLICKCGSKERWGQHFSRACCNRTKGKTFKLRG